MKIIPSESASLAVRTAREEDIKPTTPRLLCKVADSIRLARMVLKQIEQDIEAGADRVVGRIETGSVLCRIVLGTRPPVDEVVDSGRQRSGIQKV